MTRINGQTWRSIGSDVDWVNYGGTWARPLGNGLWAVLRFDSMEHGPGGYTCSGGVLDPADATASDLSTCDMDETAGVEDRLYAMAVSGGWLTHSCDGAHPFRVRARVARAVA